MRAAAITTQRDLMVQRLRRRRGGWVDLEDVLRFPDSRLVYLAAEAAREQSPELLHHAFRTAIFARALALIDKVDVDEELLVVCGLLHDAGLERAVAGQDFTERSAAVAADVARRSGRDDACHVLEDAIIVHSTVGIGAARDGALGAYTQAGAMVDLVGLRERHLPHDLVARTVARYPRSGLVRAITRAIAEESRAVPQGRFAFLRGVGFAPAIRIASVPSRR